MKRSTYDGYTKARKKANAKYKENKLETIQIYVQKGQKEKIRSFAKECDMSMNEFINRAIRKSMSEME